jgi:hypothetical protein
MRLALEGDDLVAGAFGRHPEQAGDAGWLAGWLTEGGRVLEGRWTNREAQAGHFRLRLGEDGQSFTGSYSLGGAAADENPANAWNGSKVIKAPGMNAPQVLPMSQFYILVQHYPSTARASAEVEALARSLGFDVRQSDELREGRLHPRQSEVIYFGFESQQKALRLQVEIARRLGINIGLSRSPYFGEPQSRNKIRLNLL